MSGGVEGLSSDAVSLLVDEVTTRVEVPARQGASPLARLRVLLAALGGVVTVLAVALVRVTLRLRHYRLRTEAPLSPPAPARPVVMPGVARKVT